MSLFVRSDDESLPYGMSTQRTPTTPDHSSGPGAPDVEIVTVPFTVINSGQQIPARAVSGITTGSILLKPESSGSIHLQTRSVWDMPLIDANYLATENDLNVLLKSARLILRLARTEPLASSLDLRGSPSDNDFDAYWPSDVDPDTVSNEDLKMWIRKYAQTAWHPTSSVKMGASPATSAVDINLRVHGVRGLRVADASVFPDQVSGHPCAVVFALAERAADLIKSAA